MTDDRGARILAAADISRVMALADPSKWQGIPYDLPPVPNVVNVEPNSKRQSIDCSLYILAVFAQAGIPFQGVRTAEQIRQVCLPVDWPDVKLGDLLFFEKTYNSTERATHIGISHGAGSGKMWDAHDRSSSNSAVGLTIIHPSTYWQDKIFEARRPRQYAPVTTPPPPTTQPAQIRSVDVSSHQTPSLPALRRWIADGCQLLIVKSYQRAESSLAHTTRAHVANARAAGVWCLGYVWLYRSVDPRESVRTSLELFRSTGEDPKIWFLDCETYQNSDGSIDPGPNVDQIMAAADQCRAMDVAPVIYTGNWWINGHLQGDKSKLAGMPAWLADYSKPPSLDWQAPIGLKLVGHQYTSTPVDWSLFDLDALTKLAGGGSPGDPCAALKASIRSELAVIEQALERIEALVV